MRSSGKRLSQLISMTVACALLRFSGLWILPTPQCLLLCQPSLAEPAGGQFPDPRVPPPPAPSRLYPLPPERFSTTLTINGEPAVVSLFGTSYRGVRVTMVGPKAVAKTAGIMVGDVLLSLNSQDVESPEQVDAVLNRTPSGDLNVVLARQVEGRLKLIENRIRYRNPLIEYADVSQSHPPEASSDCADLERQILALINSDRASTGFKPPAPPLRPSHILAQIARDYARDMAKRGYFSHTDPEGRDTGWRLGPAHVETGYAENLSEGANSAEAVERYFMAEPAGVPGNHRANILNPDFAYIGVGAARRSDGTVIVVEEFSHDPPDEASLQ